MSSHCGCIGGSRAQGIPSALRNGLRSGTLYLLFKLYTVEYSGLFLL